MVINFTIIIIVIKVSSILTWTESDQEDRTTDAENVSDDDQYGQALRTMNEGNEKSKTKVAFYKLSGRGGAEYDADGAVVLLEERVKDKDIEAMWMLGLCYEYGIGTEQDIKRAGSLYIQSRDGGSIVGKLILENGAYERGSEKRRIESLS